MRISRRLFVIPLANNNHGKSRLVNSLLSQGLGRASPGQKGRRHLVSPWGREIDAFVFIRSFQETEKQDHPTPSDALGSADEEWNRRELIVMPSHLDCLDVRQMIDTAHGAGFDAIAASILLDDNERSQYRECWAAAWDARWNLPNPRLITDWDPQLDALGRDLWIWTCKAMLT